MNENGETGKRGMHHLVCYLCKDPCPLSRFVPCPSFLISVVVHCQPSVGREGTNRVHWPVSKKPVSTKQSVTQGV